MDGEKACKTLADHLVERIIAMIPFPAIFKARCLSKSWRARFSSIASQDDQEMKLTANLFQNLVSERSKYWETFWPVFIGTNGDLIAYDKKTHSWQKMPSMSFLPKKVLRNSNMQIDGALLYSYDFRPLNSYIEIDGSLWYSYDDFRRNEDMYVANILTQTWKQLPLPPTSGCPVYTSKLVVTDRSLGTYKVVLFSQRDLYETDFPLFQIYDSKLDSWSYIELDFKWSYDPFESCENWSSVFFGDIFYLLGGCQNLLAFDIRQGTFKELELQLSDPFNEGWEDSYSLMVCEEELLMVIPCDSYDIFPTVLKIDLDSLTLTERNSGAPILTSLELSDTSPTVLKIDLESLTLTAWNSGAPILPSLELSSLSAMAPVGDKDHIFDGYVKYYGSRMRAYDVKEQMWSDAFAPPSANCDYKWIASVQPGFGPFAAV